MKLAFRTIYEAMIQDVGFHVLTTISIILIVTSFFIPPLGIIDPSVFIGVGELFAFAGLWELHVAIRKGMDAKIRHGNTSMYITGDKNKLENDSESEEAE